MARLYLFAEGQTEQTFADTLLKPHLAKCGVFMHNPVLIAHARKKGKVHRGGGRNFIAMQKDICRFLKQETAKDVFFTTMIDLYALHPDFPGREEAEKMRSTPHKRVQALEKSWFAMSNDYRFIPYIQLHEYEAYLLADVSQFGVIFDQPQSGIAKLQQIVDAVSTPELVNDGIQTAPSKIIADCFPDYAPSKRTLGPLLAKLIGLATIRTKCPHFHEWLLQLEQLNDPVSKTNGSLENN